MYNIVEIIITILDEDLEHYTPNKSLSGNIYWKLDDELYFPEENWYDFPLTLLTWWTESLVQIAIRSIDKADLIFMDGPQIVTISIHGDDCLAISCRESKSLPPFYTGVVNKKKFIRRFVLASTRFLDWCKNHNVECDFITLDHNLRSLKQQYHQ